MALLNMSLKVPAPLSFPLRKLRELSCRVNALSAVTLMFNLTPHSSASHKQFFLRFRFSLAFLLL